MGQCHWDQYSTHGINAPAWDQTPLDEVKMKAPRYQYSVGSIPCEINAPWDQYPRDQCLVGSMSLG